MKNGLRSLLAMTLLSVCGLSWANAPVEDLTQRMVNGDQGSPEKRQRFVNSGDSGSRVDQLQHTVKNLVAMDLPGQMEELREQVQRLQGRIDLLSHRLAKLSEKQQTYYEDLDKRINELSKGSSSNGSAPRHPNNATASEHGNAGQAKSSSQAGHTPQQGQAVDEAYEKAFYAVQNQQYDQAIQRFKAFLKHYPDSQYAANAHYWLGELYYVKGDAKKAKQALKTVTQQFKKTSKVPAAQLKLGLIALDEDQPQKAKTILTGVVQNYPQSSAARIAKQYLAQIDNNL